MSHLTDMEELLATIPGGIIRDYMREAMACYMAGAYRGCVVLSYIALFDDLLEKLHALGGVNAVAKGVHDAAKRKKDEQDVYEAFLISQLASKSLLSGLDSDFLEILRMIRNKSAHPSGHKPSAEEARYIFSETIRRFLSRPILSTTFLVEDILSRLSNTNFFNSREIEDIRAIVEEEIQTLHPEAITQLVIRLCAATREKSTRKNARFFIAGLASLKTPETREALRSKLIAAKSDNEEFFEIVMEALAADGKLFEGSSPTTSSRVRSIIAKAISDIKGSAVESTLSHPISVLTSLAEDLPNEEFKSTFNDEVLALFEKRAHSPEIIPFIGDNPSLIPEYFAALKARAGSYTFDVAKTFANALAQLDKGLAKILSDEQSFELLVAVAVAAQHGTFAAQDIVDAKFSKAPKLKRRALGYIGKEPQEAAGHIAVRLTYNAGVDEFAKEYFGVPDDAA